MPVRVRTMGAMGDIVDFVSNVATGAYDYAAGAAKTATGFIEGNKGQTQRGEVLAISGGAEIQTTVGAAVGSVTSPIAHAVSDAWDDIAKVPVVGSIAQRLIKAEATVLAAPYVLALDISTGNISGLGQEVKDLRVAYSGLAEAAAAVASFIPGIGTGVAMCLGAAAALMEGRDISDALINACRDAVPGGVLAQEAFESGRAFVEGLANGEKLDAAALDAARTAAIQAAEDLGLPYDQAAAAWDLAVGLCQGKRLQNQLLAEGEAMFPDEAAAVESAYATGSDAYDSAVQAYAIASDVMSKVQPDVQFGLDPAPARALLNPIPAHVLIRLGRAVPETAEQKNMRLYGTNDEAQIEVVLAYRDEYKDIAPDAMWSDVQADLQAEDADKSAEQLAQERATFENELNVIRAEKAAAKVVKADTKKRWGLRIAGGVFAAGAAVGGAALLRRRH